ATATAAKGGASTAPAASSGGVATAPAPGAESLLDYLLGGGA
ncbi:MAG: hypothetical protein JWO90_3190, partial [Solirubrobacterales bacterium]|nr:hypothetical protein [Solirubrobacterales bacterium]